MDGVHIAEAYDPVAHFVPEPGRGLVGLGDLLRRGIAPAVEVAQHHHGLETEMVQAVHQEGRIGKQAPVVHVGVDHAETLELVH